MAAFGGSDRPAPDSGNSWRRNPSSNAFCCRCLRKFCQKQIAFGGGRVVAHGTVFQKIDRSSHGSPARILSVDGRRARLFYRPPYASARRCRIRLGLGDEKRSHARRTGIRVQRSACEVRYSLGDARRALFCVRGTGLAASRRVSAAERIVMAIDSNSKPQLAPGVRLGENNNQRVLLMPERALRLNGPSLEIVSRCDGNHTVAQIVADLQKLYSKAEPHKVEADILGYLELLQKERALDFVA